jgi:superfamily II DNA/RNA helicase
MITNYQAQYYAHQLSRRRASDDTAKLSTALIDAKVDLNPHQVEAALFAFRSPLSRGAILADEVGLGKTIEAGILLSQLWATGKRRLLIICPSSLRKQWSQELLDKFYIPSVILEGKNFNEQSKAGIRNPFDAHKVVICSFHFAKNKALFLDIPWDLVVIDEAHRLRNVYRPSNQIGRAIKEAIYPYKKVLLTATPLQNSLTELYGLVSIIDEQVFGSVDSFRSQFTRTDEHFDYADLKDRIKPVVKRTLRRQVQEYIRYTQRIPITIEFEPSPEEKELYRLVSEYLQRELLWALPTNQRHLLTLVVRKLLASSSYAITGTLESLIRRMEKLLDENAPSYNFEGELWQDLEHLDELMEEWEEEIEENQDKLTLEEVESIKFEIEELKGYRNRAMGIEHDAKAGKLMTALETGFSKLKKLGAANKAIIFTESRRTQDYLLNKFSDTQYAGKVVLFNGSNNDEFSRKVYKSWLAKHEGTDRVTGSKTADKRQALVDYFKDTASIMIATEAAAEGINLQFCSMLINYDLPWNPQRIEQRIGRCHRYGQKHDVVVVNFLNTDNAADLRVFQLLDEKFHLFSGIFGASDEVLGALESGVDFEKKIADIYQTCRTTEEITTAFDDLQAEMQEKIANKLKTTQEKLMEHFDAEVLDKLKVVLEESKAYLSKFERWLWLITQLFLKDAAVFDSKKVAFNLIKNPFSFKVKTGEYSLDKKNEAAHQYRMNHPIANGIIKHYRNLKLPVNELEFNFSNGNKKIAALDSLTGKSGWLRLSSIEVNSFEVTDHLVFVAFTDEGEILQQDQSFRMLELHANDLGGSALQHNEKTFKKIGDDIIQGVRIELKNKDAYYLQTEVNKLNRWAEDRIYMVEKELKDTKARIKELNRTAAQTREPVEQLAIQKKLRELEKRQRKQRQYIFDAEDQINDQRDAMIEEIEKRMQRSFKETQIFTIRWKLI